jgi:hypothetical protein
VSGHAERQPIVDAEPARPIVAPKPPKRQGTYRSRFVLFNVILALAAGVGVGALVVLLTRPDAVPSPSWSAWEPTGSSNARVLQIADHVAKEYKFQGDQLVVALGGKPMVTDAGNTNAQIPIRAIAVRPDTSTGQAEEDDIEIVDASKSIEYVLCGLGDGCSIAQGPPTEARGTFLRRQSLELALYTFKYVDGVESVTVMLPPLPDGQTPPSAVFLKRGDIGKELSKPLTQTLSPITPTIGTIKATELQTLNRITRPNLYQVAYTQAQDASPILILSPVP